jgi:rRNA maturation protein Rpf1
MLTIPGSIFKSFTKDLTLLIFELVLQHRSHAHFTERRAVRHVMILNVPGGTLMHTHVTSRRVLGWATHGSKALASRLRLRSSISLVPHRPTRLLTALPSAVWLTMPRPPIAQAI